MTELIYGADTYGMNIARRKFHEKYFTDDSNFLLIPEDDVSEKALKAAMRQLPIFADTFLIELELDSQKLYKFRDIIRPNPSVSLLVFLKSPVYNANKGIVCDKVTEFPRLKKSDLVSWIGKCAKDLDLSITKDERIYIADLFPERSQVEPLLIQLSLLPQYDYKALIDAQAKANGMWLWDLCAFFITGDFKGFCREYGRLITADREPGADIMQPCAGLYSSIHYGLMQCTERALEDPGCIPDWLSARFTSLPVCGNFALTLLLSMLADVRTAESAVGLLHTYKRISEALPRQV